MRATWVLAVRGLMTSWRAMSALLRPAATSRGVSRSRSVRSARWGGGGGGAGGGGESGVGRPGHGGGGEAWAGGAVRGGLQELAGARVLEQEAAGAGPERGVDVLVEVEGGEHEHTRAGERRVGADQPGRLEPVEDGHADVHQDDVREDPPGDVDGLPAVAGFA